MLEQWQPSSSPVLLTAMLRPIRRSHTICAFNNLQGSLWFFDNKTLKREDYQIYNDVATKIGERAKRLVCWDVVEPETLQVVEFHRT